MIDSDRQFLIDNGWEQTDPPWYFYDGKVTKEIFHGNTALEIQRKRTSTTPRVIASSPSSAILTSVSIVAQDILHAYDPVTVIGKLADSGNNACYGKVIGLMANDLGIGFSGDVIVDGLLTNPAWSWTPGSPIYLNGTSLSQTAPSTGFSQEIGISKTSTTIYVNLSAAILL